jgi:hypothetical protein
LIQISHSEENYTIAERNVSRKILPILAAGERQIDQVVAYYATGGQGTLYLTDRRIIFEYALGLMHKKYYQLGIALGQIQFVSAKHGHFGSQEIVIAAKDANNGFKSNMIALRIAMHPEIWINKINYMLSGGATTLPHNSPAQQTTIIEREVIKIPCKYCGTLNDAVRSQTCSQCGAPVYKG